MPTRVELRTVATGAVLTFVLLACCKSSLTISFDNYVPNVLLDRPVLWGVMRYILVKTAAIIVSTAAIQM